MKRMILLAITLMMATGTFAQNYKTATDLPYSTNKDAYSAERCQLDVYYPTDAPEAVPAVVWFHGGGLTGGNRYIPEQLMNSGLAVISVNYRLMPRAAITDCFDDAAAAVAWTLAHAAEYGIDPKKVYVSGHSAGGYLTTMIELDKTYLGKYGIDPDSLAGYFPLSGQAVTHYAQRALEGIGPLTATIDKNAPLFHVRAGIPLTLIISGDRELELYGRYEEQAYFWRMLKLVGNTEVYLYEMQGYDHGAMPAPAFQIMKNHIFR